MSDRQATERDAVVRFDALAHRPAGVNGGFVMGKRGRGPRNPQFRRLASPLPPRTRPSGPRRFFLPGSARRLGPDPRAAGHPDSLQKRDSHGRTADSPPSFSDLGLIAPILRALR